MTSFLLFDISSFLSAANNSGYDWTDFGPFGAAVVIAWFLLNRSDKVVDKEKLEAERDLLRVQKQLEDERKAHEATRKLLYERLALEAQYDILMQESDEEETE